MIDEMVHRGRRIGGGAAAEVTVTQEFSAVADESVSASNYGVFHGRQNGDVGASRREDDRAGSGTDPDSDSDDGGFGGGLGEGIIAPIDGTTVSRLVAGQAVSDLAGAVKELVDNALDAEACSITGET